MAVQEAGGILVRVDEHLFTALPPSLAPSLVLVIDISEPIPHYNCVNINGRFGAALTLIDAPAPDTILALALRLRDANQSKACVIRTLSHLSREDQIQILQSGGVVRLVL